MEKTVDLINEGKFALKRIQLDILLQTPISATNSMSDREDNPGRMTRMDRTSLNAKMNVAYEEE